MKRKLTKQEFKLIREYLGYSQSQWAELLNVSLSHIKHTETNGAGSYDVSGPLDRKVKVKLEQLEINLEEILELVKVQERVRKSKL